MYISIYIYLQYINRIVINYNNVPHLLTILLLIILIVIIFFYIFSSNKLINKYMVSQIYLWNK